LGGKSPVIVDSSADLSLTAKRILWGKINNCGQICVAPDYLLAEKSIIPGLVAAFKEHYASFFPEGPLASDSYSRIVSDAHFDRLKSLLGRTHGQIVLGGKWEEGGGRGMEPTVITDVKEDDALLEGYVRLARFRFCLSHLNIHPVSFSGPFCPSMPSKISTKLLII